MVSDERRIWKEEQLKGTGDKKRFDIQDSFGLRTKETKQNSV